jgi:DNA-binding GntR family transcriptional regulator
VIEGYSARRAAARLSDDEIGALRESCARFEAFLAQGADMSALVKENLVFHQTIYEGAGSTRLTSMVRQVIELPLVYRSYVWYSPDQQRISAHYHAQITRALETRDGERAELVMKEHIFEARDLLLTHWRELEAES